MEPSTVIIITGSIIVKSDTFDELRALSLAHVARSRTEDGCISHDVSVDCENALRLVFIERWRDRAAILKHFADPHTRAFAASARNLAQVPPTLNLFAATEIPLSSMTG